MTVADLIESLKEFPADAEVYVTGGQRPSQLSGLDWNGAVVVLLDLSTALRETTGDPSDDDD